MIIDNILIDTNDIEFAKDICNVIDDSVERSKSVANILGPQIASKIFNEMSIEADTDSGIYGNVEVLQNIDISDIYINGSYVDVRLYADGEPLSIPANIFNNLHPIAFMFIKIDSDLHHGALSGFIPYGAVDTNSRIDDFYYVKETDLVQFEDIEHLLTEKVDGSVIDDVRIYNYIDNKIDDKYEFYSQLIKSKESRIKFKKCLKAASILNFVSSTYNTTSNIADSEIITDDTLLTESDNSIAQESIFNDLLEEKHEESENIIDTTLSLLEEPDSSSSYSDDNSDKYSTNTFTNIDSSTVETEENTSEDAVNQEESIEELFSEERLDSETEFERKQGANKFRIMVASIIALIVALFAYIGFAKLGNNTEKVNNEISSENSLSSNEFNNNTDVMPMESVESTNLNENKEIGNTINMPAIEKNLDASVVVANLKVDWEVPSGYAANTSAKRYLIKLGKVIQHNLKTELLLLNKLPITNNVAIELKFNGIKGQFEVVGITSSSGEKTVDDIISKTVNNALKIKLSSSISNFTKLQGNPILVIHF